MLFINARTLFLILMICMMFPAAALSQADDKPLIDENAQAMLKSVVDAIGAAENGSLQIENTVVFSMGGMKDGYDKHYLFAWNRPNRFAWKTQGDTVGPNVISDGHKLFHYIESTSAYVESDAPATLADLSFFPNQEDYIQGIRNPETIYEDFLLGKTPWKTLTKELKSITFERDDSNEKGVHAIRLERDDFGYTFWVKEGESPSLVKIRPEWNDFIAQGGFNGANGMTIENTIQITNWSLNQGVNPEIFTFKPGADIRKAESIDDAMTQPAPPAPEFSVELMDGGQFSLAENKGKKYIILDFWATWCPPCRAAMPVLEKIAEKYKEKDVIVIAVNQQETPDKIKKFLEQNDLHPTVALDSGSIGNLYEVSALPTMVIIDKEGMIQDYIEGFDPEIEQRLLAVMK